jgi:hypothetical protein
MDSMIRDAYSGTLSSSRWLNQASLLKDLDYASRRLCNEGLPFLTDLLPKLGKAVDLALETKHLSPVPGIKSKNGTNLPQFLHGKFRCVFDAEGILLDQPDPYSIQELRQILFFFYKLELPFTEVQEKRSIESFVNAENDLLDQSFGHCDRRIVERAQYLLNRLFSGYDPRKILPGHGPGSVNTGEKGNEKWTFKRLYSHIHQKYPYYDYFVVSRTGEILDRVQWYKSLDRLDKSHSKVCLVPKDSRGPRVISVEPLEVQYIQQGQMKSLVRWIEKHPLTRGFLNFTDQSINQELALASSRTREYSTLDLKEASDRVHCNLVRILFPEEVTDYLFATRSEGTFLPNGSYVKFRKFAPMGSATCFPVLALTIWSLTRAYLDVNRTDAGVYVYGDDVIVPTDYAGGLVSLLEDFGLRVNKDKSFIRGFFRESCGVDAYKGVNVTPLRLRRSWSRKSTDFALYAHLVSLSERMHQRGFWKTERCLRENAEALFGRIPFGTRASGFPCISLPNAHDAEILNKKIGVKSRYKSDYQRFEFLVRVYDDRKQETEFTGWNRLLSGVLSPSFSDPSVVTFRQACNKLVWRYSAI